MAPRQAGPARFQAHETTAACRAAGSGGSKPVGMAASALRLQGNDNAFVIGAIGGLDHLLDKQRAARVGDKGLVLQQRFAEGGDFALVQIAVGAGDDLAFGGAAGVLLGVVAADAVHAQHFDLAVVHLADHVAAHQAAAGAEHFKAPLGHGVGNVEIGLHRAQRAVFQAQEQVGGVLHLVVEGQRIVEGGHLAGFWSR